MLTLYWLDQTTQGEDISLFTSESVYLDGYLLRPIASKNAKYETTAAIGPSTHFSLSANVDPLAPSSKAIAIDYVDGRCMVDCIPN